MQYYENLYKLMDKLGMITQHRHRKIENEPYMPLSIERVFDFPTDENSYCLSIAHTYEQNGDLMRDPEIVVEVDRKWKTVQALSFQQDGFGGLYQRVYEYDDTGKKTGIRVQTKNELNRFLRKWLLNIKRQGFGEAILKHGAKSASEATA